MKDTVRFAVSRRVYVPLPFEDPSDLLCDAVRRALHLLMEKAEAFDPASFRLTIRPTEGDGYVIDDMRINVSMVGVLRSDT